MRLSILRGKQLVARSDVRRTGRLLQNCLANISSGRGAVGSAPALGAGGRGFEPRRPDQHIFIPLIPLFLSLMIGKCGIRRDFLLFFN